MSRRILHVCLSKWMMRASLLLLAFLCIPHRAKADTVCSSTAIGAYTCKQSTSMTPVSCTSSTGGTSAAMTITAGDPYIIIGTVQTNTAPTNTLLLSPADTFADSGLGAVVAGTNGGSVQIWYVKSAIGGSTTATLKPNSTNPCAVNILDFSPNINVTTPVRATASNPCTSGSCTSPASSGTVASSSGDLIIGVLQSSLSNGGGAGSGGSTALSFHTGGPYVIVGQSATGAQAIQCTYTNGENYIMAGVAFEPSGGTAAVANPSVFGVH